ncbi:hypothetical protein AHMF7605_10055 [Adhaeribacter arboris]|uniref:Uncharacterized protein n=2 Tax=Adhaeribacter arboris TaxID=2072846 RepID=A0A2T2YEF4_9BACT|nr:hypothetical protein AHMF7605_10055 [Adhaeribacter arboris]
MYGVHNRKGLVMLLDKTMVLTINFYHFNKENLKRLYAGRYLLIKDEKLIGDFNAWVDALRHGLNLFNNDDFFIKYCV